MNNQSQDIRCQIVLKCLDIFRDVDVALSAAQKVESYVYNGEGRTGSMTGERRQLQSTAPTQASRSSPALPSLGETRQTADRTAATGAGDNAPASAGGAEAPAKLRQGSGPKRRWNPEDERVLREMWENGEETSAIAEALQRTPASVRERARALSLVRRKAESQKRGGNTPARSPLRKGGAQTRGRNGYRRAGRNNVHTKDDGPSIHDIEAYRIRRPVDTMETVINFVRSRDYSVTTKDSGGFVVDGHRHMGTEEFIAWANNLRRQMNKPEFPLSVGEASPSKGAASDAPAAEAHTCSAEAPSSQAGQR